MNYHLPILAAVLAAASLQVVAQETVQRAIVVIGTDGSRHELVIDEVDRMEFGSSSLTLHSTAGQSTEHGYESVDRILIGTEKSAVKSAIADGSIAVWPTAVETTVNIAGAETGTTVAVYDLSGAVVATSRTTDGVLSIDLSSAASGMYIVSVANHSVKIVKK